MRALPAAALLVTALAALACSESSPTAPSAMDPTAPVETSTVVPTPAPVSQTLTGTWTGAGHTFTVTQIGNAAVGMIARRTMVIGEGVTLTESTTITGTVIDATVTLQMTDRATINGPGMTTDCAAGRMFIGALSGNSLSGTLAPTAPLNCGNDPHGTVSPKFIGPVVYTRQ